MATRRKFLVQSGLLAGAAVLPNFAFSFNRLLGNGFEPGIQLYTIRKAMSENPKEGLRKIAELGYKTVEHASYGTGLSFYGMSTEEMKQVLKETGLKMLSGHYMLGNADTEGAILNEKTVQEARKVGIKYMVCPALPGIMGEKMSLEDYKRTVEDFHKAGELCKKYGIQFCYHNHNFEFQETEGEIPYFYLLDNCDEELVKFEMDIFWINRAGYDPINFFDQYPGRFVLWHVKDMVRMTDRGISDTMAGSKDITEVGNGVIDWPSLFARANKAGLEHFFVEQDNAPENDPFPHIESSIKYLKNNIL